jgi:predicted enzyme related to lactoylglutathione lyase
MKTPMLGLRTTVNKVDDIATEFARLKSLGATAESDPVNVGGDIMVAELKDPWGNTIGLIYNPVFNLPELT